MLRKYINIEELLESEFAIIPTNWFSDNAIAKNLIGDTGIYILKIFLRKVWFPNFEIKNQVNGFLNGKIKIPNT